MSIRDKIAGWIAPDMAKKAAAVTPDGSFGWTSEGFIGDPTGLMDAETAAKVSAVFACVTIVAEAIGSLPLDIKEKNGGDGVFRLFDTLNYQPNPLQTGADFWQEMAFSAALYGEAVSEPVAAGGGIEIWPMPQSRLIKRVQERKVAWEYSEIGGVRRVIGPMDVFRFNGLSVGLEQIVPWKVAKASINLARVLEQQGEKFFQNSARLAGFLSTSGALTEEAVKRIKNQFANFQGAVNAGKTPIFEEGMKYENVSASNQDSQYVEIREFQIKEIARYWKIPLYMLGIEGTGKTTSEQQAQDFVKYTVRPWARRIEQSIARDLMTEDERAAWSVKFNLEGLLRGDSQTRARNRVLDRTSGTISINEGRAQEGLPKIDEAWADDVREPLNSNRAADTMSGGETAPQDQDQNDD